MATDKFPSEGYSSTVKPNLRDEDPTGLCDKPKNRQSRSSEGEITTSTGFCDPTRSAVGRNGNVIAAPGRGIKLEQKGVPLANTSVSP